MTHKEFAEQVLVKAIGRLEYKLTKGLRGYDHIHFSINGTEPLDSEMGTCAGSPPDLSGMVELFGRARDGRHYTLWGPVTADEYRKAVMNA
jgi:hypothetical protein